jgi:hypothetical protein
MVNLGGKFAHKFLKQKQIDCIKKDLPSSEADIYEARKYLERKDALISIIKAKEDRRNCDYMVLYRISNTTNLPVIYTIDGIVRIHDANSPITLSNVCTILRQAAMFKGGYLQVQGLQLFRNGKVSKELYLESCFDDDSNETPNVSKLKLKKGLQLKLKKQPLAHM